MHQPIGDSQFTFGAWRYFLFFLTDMKSFYSSQGRQTSFQDHNASLIDHLKAAVPGLVTLEVGSFFAHKPSI